VHGHKTAMHVNGAPKSFFKALFIIMHFRTSLRRMSHLRTVPDRLKPQECKKNAGWSKTHIPYIPEKDVLQEALDISVNSLTLTMPHKVELRVLVWSQGPPKQCLMHVQQAFEAIRQKGLLMPLRKLARNRRSAPRS